MVTEIKKVPPCGGITNKFISKYIPETERERRHYEQ